MYDIDIDISQLRALSFSEKAFQQNDKRMIGEVIFKVYRKMMKSK